MPTGGTAAATQRTSLLVESHEKARERATVVIERWRRPCPRSLTELLEEAEEHLIALCHFPAAH
jgi:transposase-like protein